MRKTALVVMAAGLGSRYGGLKQIDPVGPAGQILLDYTVYDAARAGFSDVVFIIRPELAQAFAEGIGARAEKLLRVHYAYQTTDKLPEGLPVPDRSKPLGTAHAVWCAAQEVGEMPFAVVNADDFYGADALKQVHDFLVSEQKGELPRYCMVGYRVENTLTENGTVSRGVCRVGADGLLQDITERTDIARNDRGEICCTGENGTLHLPEGTSVSMNLWGFDADFLQTLTAGIRDFMTNDLPKNPEKAEYYLPRAVEQRLQAGQAEVFVLHTAEKWFGVTYQQDKAAVSAAIAALTEQGAYPKQW